VIARFEFATASRIVFGAGASAECPAVLTALGRRVFVVRGRHASRSASLVASLASAGLAAAEFSVAREPDVELIRQGVHAARTAGVDAVLGIGGGSVLDAAKAIAILAAHDGDVFDYLEVIGKAQPFPHAALPCVAVPTTAGTGSEVTRNSVIASPEHRVKVRLRSPSMLPRVAIVDPDLTRDLPPALTASTGLDALTQLIEPYLSRRANPPVDAWCLEGIRRAARSLPRAVHDGQDADARADMALASLLGGLALANAGLGAVHGFAGPIGGMFDAPHGAVCAALLPHVFAANHRAMVDRGQDDRLERFDHIARALTGRDSATVVDAISWLNELVDALHIPTLRAYGLRESDLPDIVQRARQASSMNANPVELTTPELTGILRRAW
jgi:alcohol dehydrogenase class IV